jgi:hypothetical protein
VIIEQSKYDEENVIEVEKDWKILTFDMVLPFRLFDYYLTYKHYNLLGLYLAHLPE